MTGLTSAERALELFRQRPPGENRIDWLANQLLALAAEGGPLSLRITPSDGELHPTFECSDSVHVIASEDPGPLRLFRTLLARLAKMAEEENGTAFDPYGGKLHFDRPDSTGPVRLDVEFDNTTTAQSLTMVKALLPRPIAPRGG
jgi:hypothetical protein